MTLNKIQIGADPELFLKDKDTGEFIPVIGLLGGTKESPKQVGEGHFVQEDNVMAEFNIPPCSTPEDFVENIQYGIDQIQDIIPDALQTVALPSVDFAESWLEEPQACISGCDPYKNAWKDGKIEEAVSLEDTVTRSAGGHIHISYDNPDEQLSMQLIRNCDLFTGIPSVLLDEDEKRRETYGKAGSYRDKDYGVEYRSLSNFWLGSPKLIEWVYNNIQSAIQFTNEGKQAPNSVERIMNGSHKKQAQELIDKFNINMP